MGSRPDFSRGCVFAVSGCVGLVVVAFVALILVAWIRTSSQTERHLGRVEEASEQKRISAAKPLGLTAVQDESRASREDVEQADEFLQALPEFCADSTAQAEQDGSITIHVRCDDGSDSLSRAMSIRDGIVRELR